MRLTPLALACATTFSILIADNAVAATWCGNQCADGDDGIQCTDWQPGAANQMCKAKAICSSTCTSWWTA